MKNEAEKRIRHAIKTAIANKEVMGINVLVEAEGEQWLYCEEGMANLENGREIKRDTIFRLYSQTKPVTAVAAMILMERGELDFCQPVGELLPVFLHSRVVKENGVTDSTRPMLIHDLLRMTSGLVYPDVSNEAGKAVHDVFEEACIRLNTNHPVTTMELVNRLGECPLMFEPGSSWEYGTSADVLGAVIEVITGEKLSEFMEDEIFSPLGMRDTAFWVPEEKQERLAAAYETIVERDGNRHLVPYTGNHLAICYDMRKPPAFESGGAGLVSTLDDYMRFARMLLNGGIYNGRRILNPQTVKYFVNGMLLPAQQEAFRNWVGLNGYTYGNLMRVCKKPSCSGLLTREGEYGWDGWLGMYFANFPNEKMTILIGTQKKDGGTFTLTRKIRNIILSCFN